MSEITKHPSQTEYNSRILELRNSKEYYKAIDLCLEASRSFPDNNFYPNLAGDLYLNIEDYDSASEMYLESLRRLPPSLRLFPHFAKRYYRLKRVLNKNKISEFAERIMSLVKEESFDKQIAFYCKDLIRNDLPRANFNSREGKLLIDLLKTESLQFRKIVAQTKKLEREDPSELQLILEENVLNRERTSPNQQIDTFFISIYEKLEKYHEALKIAKELLSISLESVVIRSIFRICRKIGNYETADEILEAYPAILKRNDFNITYELVYYFETKDDIEGVKTILEKMEKQHADSLSIQKTVRNFYLRFGLLEDVNRVRARISKLHEARGKIDEKFSEEIQESEAGLGSKIKELYSKLEHRTRLAAISDLTTGISHELGQPITNIRYTAQFYRKLFQENIDKKTVINVFNSILEETQRMGNLIKRLAPITSSKEIFEFFDIVGLIKKRIHSANVRLKAAKILVNISPQEPIEFYGDPVAFDQVISNLLLNSIDALKDKKVASQKRIDISVEINGDGINITFSDTGSGIPVKYRGKIFDPFFSTKAPGKGEGLGLFIVWNLLKMQGGKLTLDTNYNQGARFLIFIPKFDQDKMEP